MIIEASEHLKVIALAPRWGMTETYRRQGEDAFLELCSLAHDENEFFDVHEGANRLQSGFDWINFSVDIRKEASNKFKETYSVDPIRVINLTFEQKTEGRLWLEDGTLPDWVTLERQAFFPDPSKRPV